MTESAPNVTGSGLPPRIKPQTVAEAKARILVHGENVSRDLEAMAERVRGDIKRSLAWLPLAAIGAGIFFGRGKKKSSQPNARESSSGADESAGKRKGSRWGGMLGWAAQLAAPMVIDLIGNVVEKAHRSRSRRD